MERSKKKSGLKLENKKNLIVHAYDAFLSAQTRLFTLGTSIRRNTSYEILCRQELLLLDDLMNFSLSARKLFEYTLLQSFANNEKITCKYVNADASDLVKDLDKSVGFHTLMSKFIHASYVAYLDTKVSVLRRLGGPEHQPNDLEQSYRNSFAHVTAKREIMIDPLIFVICGEEKYLISLMELVEASTTLAEKIIDVCADHSIFLDQSLTD